MRQTCQKHPLSKDVISTFEYLSYRLKCIWEGVSNNTACFQLPGRKEGQLWINWLIWFKQFYLDFNTQAYQQLVTVVAHFDFVIQNFPESVCRIGYVHIKLHYIGCQVTIMLWECVISDGSPNFIPSVSIALGDGEREYWEQGWWQSYWEISDIVNKIMMAPFLNWCRFNKLNLCFRFQSLESQEIYMHFLKRKGSSHHQDGKGMCKTLQL